MPEIKNDSNVGSFLLKCYIRVPVFFSVRCSYKLLIIVEVQLYHSSRMESVSKPTPGGIFEYKRLKVGMQLSMA